MEELFKKLFYKYQYSYIGFFSGTVLLFFIICVVIDPFLEKGIKNFNYRLLVYLIMVLIWLAIWLYQKFSFPANENNKIGILIAINSENSKQKRMLRNDLIEGLKDAIIDKNLEDLLHLTYVNDYKSQQIKKILLGYNAVKKQHMNKNIVNHTLTREYKKYSKFQKRTKFNLIIYGQIIERNDVENKYILNIDAIVRHRPLDFNTSNQLVKDFQRIFPREISFFEKMEFQGFKITKELIFFSSRCIIGTAALLSGDPVTAYKLHKDLLPELKLINNFYQQSKDIALWLSNLIITELIQQSRYYHLIKGDNELARKLLREAELIDNKNYDVLILNSYYSFVIDNDPYKSIEYSKDAKNYSNGNGTWLYNKAFLYMYVNNFKNAYNCYKKIRKSRFHDENLTLTQIIEFNESFYKNCSDFIQSLFILGYLYYFKINNLPLALERFDLFLKQTEGNGAYSFFHYKVISYISEIKKKMGIDN